MSVTAATWRAQQAGPRALGHLPLGRVGAVGAAASVGRVWLPWCTQAPCTDKPQRFLHTPDPRASHARLQPQMGAGNQWGDGQGGQGLQHGHGWDRTN